MLLLRKYLILLPKRISIKNQIKLILMSLLLVKLNIFLPPLNPNKILKEKTLKNRIRTSGK